MRNQELMVCDALQYKIKNTKFKINGLRPNYKLRTILKTIFLSKFLQSSSISYLLSAICYLLFAICYLLSAICYLLFAICYLLSAICYLLSANCYFVKYRKTTTRERTN